MARSLFIGILFVVCMLTVTAGCTFQPVSKVVITPTVTIPVPNGNATQKTFIALPQAPFNETEWADVIKLQEDQKYITDINTVLAAQHPEIPVFKNIANASKVYQAADNVILQRYGIPNPEKDVAGVFSSQELQLLFDNDVNTGSNSVRDALFVSARASDMHIADLEAAISRTDNPDILFIDRQQLASSRNNLRTISQWTNAYKGSYYPTFITVDYYKSLINSPVEQVPIK